MSAIKLIGIACLLSFCLYGDVKTCGPDEKTISSTTNEFSPDVNLSTLEIIKRTGNPAEKHVAKTEDGYLLTLHRIPGGNGSPPVLLVHGAFCTDVVFVTLGKEKALAYLLVEQGYDVWLGNLRGTTYSREHIFLSPSESKYWDYSFHEVGIYDVPAMITYITNMKSQPLHAYIGYSMGSSVFYVMATERPKIARMVNMMISFGPGAFLDHMKSPLRPMLYMIKELQSIMQILFHGEIFPQDVSNTLMTLIGCNLNFYRAEYCANNFIFAPCGSDLEQFNYTQLPVIVSHLPAAVSLKTVVHFVQGMQSCKFRQYDYGATKNLIIYKSVEPPEYNLSSIALPMAIYYGNNDLMVAPIDVKKFYDLLPNVIDFYEVPWPNFSHADFVVANDAPTLLYERLFQIMKGKY